MRANTKDSVASDGAGTNGGEGIRVGRRRVDALGIERDEETRGWLVFALSANAKPTAAFSRMRTLCLLRTEEQRLAE